MRLGTRTFITAIPQPTSTVPGNSPPLGHAARTKQTTGTVARIDWPAGDSPRSGSTGGISPIAVRMLNATTTTPSTASAETGAAAGCGGARGGSLGPVVVLIERR